MYSLLLFFDLSEYMTCVYFLFHFIYYRILFFGKLYICPSWSEKPITFDDFLKFIWSVFGLDCIMGEGIFHFLLVHWFPPPIQLTAMISLKYCFESRVIIQSNPMCIFWCFIGFGFFFHLGAIRFVIVW